MEVLCHKGPWLGRGSWNPPDISVPDHHTLWDDQPAIYATMQMEIDGAVGSTRFFMDFRIEMSIFLGSSPALRVYHGISTLGSTRGRRVSVEVWHRERGSWSKKGRWRRGAEGRGFRKGRGGRQPGRSLELKGCVKIQFYVYMYMYIYVCMYVYVFCSWDNYENSWKIIHKWRIAQQTTFDYRRVSSKMDDSFLSIYCGHIQTWWLRVNIWP